MEPVEIARAVNGLITTAAVLTGAVFGNLLMRKGSVSMWGVPVKAESVHLALGPALILINSLLVVLLWALTQVELGPADLQKIKSAQVWFWFGPVFNPFYAGRNKVLNSLGYACLIALWWMAMHSFVYSLEKNDPAPLLFGWRVLYSVLFLAAGLASMLAIQICWKQWDIEAYRWKWRLASVGIAVGGFGIPLLFKLGLPDILKR